MAYGNPAPLKAGAEQDRCVTVSRLPRIRPDKHNITVAHLNGVAQDIAGIKLEPIVALPTSCLAGMEVLSVMACGKESEDFFQRQSARQLLAILEAQLIALKNVKQHGNLFVNLPITALLEPEPFQRLLLLCHPHLNIEIVDPASFFTLSAVLQARLAEHLRLLSARGCGVWLDDVDEMLIQRFLTCRLPLSGVKIDKQTFWRLRATSALKRLVTLSSEVAEHVLIEGIETNRDREYALHAGAGFGQGYYWPSLSWPGG